MCEIRSAADSSLTLKVDIPVLEKAPCGLYLPSSRSVFFLFVCFFASCSLCSVFGNKYIYHDPERTRKGTV